jgi:hypothetical protein
MSEEQLTPVPEVEPVFKTTLTQAELDAATKEIASRSFSKRHPELGKMINCAVCGRRHRSVDSTYRNVVDEENNVSAGAQLMTVRAKCEQAFTYTVKDKEGRSYRQYREVEGENGEVEVTPDYRTAVPANAKPTMRQINGRPNRPNQFVGPRYNPHPSKIKLLFIQRVREVFEELGFELVDAKSDEFKALTPDEQKAKAEKFHKELHRARVVAARQIREEFRANRKRRRKLGIR